MRVVGDAEAVLRPGEEFHYSNLVFALLGEVVARLRGSTYEDVLLERVLEPLGLERTRLVPEPPVARGYYVLPWSDEATLEADFALPTSTSALGWLWSTVDDLARWADFLCVGDDRVLRAVVGRRDGAARGDGRRRVDGGLRPRPRARAPGRPDLRGTWRGDAGIPGVVRRRAARANGCGGVDVDERERLARAPCARPRGRRARPVPAAGGGLDATRDTAGARAAARDVVDGGLRDRARGARRPPPRPSPRGVRAGSSCRTSRARATTAGDASRDASAASCSSSIATPTVRSNACPSRRTR